MRVISPRPRPVMRFRRLFVRGQKQAIPNFSDYFPLRARGALCTRRRATVQLPPIFSTAPRADPSSLSPASLCELNSNPVKAVRTMFQRYVICRLGSLAACGAVLLSAGRGSAQTQSCSASYEAAKEKEDSGHLLEARGHYASCAKKVCGAFLLNECITRHARLDTDIPSVVPFATDSSGEARTDVRVTVDGDALVSRIDGRSVRVDPGMHEFVFHGADGVTVSEKVMVLQGDHNRRIGVSLAPPKSAKAPVALPVAVPVVEPPAVAPKDTAEPGVGAEAVPTPKLTQHREAPAEPVPAAPARESSSKGIPVASWVLGGVGVLGVGGFILLSANGRSDNNSLAQSCGATGSCQQSSVDHIKRNYVIADVSLGVGIAALGGAVLAYALSGPSQKERPAEEQAYRVHVQPTHSGAVAAISGSF